MITVKHCYITNPHVHAGRENTEKQVITTFIYNYFINARTLNRQSCAALHQNTAIFELVEAFDYILLP